MCNDYANHVPWSEYVEAFSDIKLPVVLPKAALNLEPRDDIWPTDPAPIIRRTEGGVEIAQVRWGFSPPRPKAPPVINFRSEGRKFERGRCLVPASWFYEFRGAKAPKEKWRFKRAGQDWFCFAGIWRPANANGPEAFMLLTTEPGPDVAPIHNRQVVIVERENWARWLDASKPAADLLHALPQGSLQRLMLGAAGLGG
jgi:putative SOS response-associated peptidase YedK